MAHHRNFNLISGDMTGTNRFQTGFNGLTDIPPEIKKAIDSILTGLSNTFCFLDNISIMSSGRIEDHLQLVRKRLINLDEENLRINLSKGHFANILIELLGHRITQSGATPLENKTAAIQELTSPTNFKKQRLFLVLRQLSPYIYTNLS